MTMGLETTTDYSKIALVGTAPSSRLLAPCTDPSWQIWACSPDNMLGLSRVDAWFELHDLGYPEYQASLRPYLDWLREQSFTIYAQGQKHLPKALTFPKDELIGHFGRRFFTSSFAWMIAFALTKGVKEIGLYGVDMSASEEYRQQRPGVHHFLEIAEASGVSITVPYESDILQPPPLYGYDRNSAWIRKLEIRRHEICEKLAFIRSKRADIERRICMLQGAMDKTLVADIAKQGPAAAQAKLGEMQALNKECEQGAARLAGAREMVDYMLTIWSGHDVSDMKGAQGVQAEYAALNTSEPFESPNPLDIIAQQARRAKHQPIPYQEDELLTIEPSLLAGFADAGGSLRNGEVH